MRPVERLTDRGQVPSFLRMSEALVPVLPPDYHTHNALCKHARGKPVDYVRAALHNGISEIACTDHCPTDDGFGAAHRMELPQFQSYIALVSEAKQASQRVSVLLGIEADFYRGCEPFLRRLTGDHPLDLVLGSVHFLDYWNPNTPFRTLEQSADPVELWRRYFALMQEMAETRLYDIVSHLDLPKRFGNAIDRKVLRELALPALDAVARSGMCIEINTSGALHAGGFYPASDFLQWAAERSIGLTFGSDAHSPDRVGDGFVAAMRMAREAGFTHYQRFSQRRRTAVAF